MVRIIKNTSGNDQFSYSQGKNSTANLLFSFLLYLPGVYSTELFKTGPLGDHFSFLQTHRPT